VPKRIRKSVHLHLSHLHLLRTLLLPQTGKIKAAWFIAHRAMNSLACVMALAAVIIMFVRFGWFTDSPIRYASGEWCNS
jgi:hypothetical protein